MLAAAFLATGSVAATAPDTPNPVRMNQLGFLPAGAKRAILADPSATPLDWRLFDGAGRVRGAGRTEPFGDDAASGEHVHRIDLGAVSASGPNYRIEIGARSSRPFSISPAIYDRLRMDSINY